MRILALETSAKTASCALFDRGSLVSELFLNAGLTHSQTIMPMVKSMLELAGLTACDVDLFAVSNGPGSFTGVRIGVSAIKGMAEVLNAPCAGISTLEALAFCAPVFQGAIVPVMDARREQVYTAVFSGGGIPKRRTSDMAISMDELGDKLTELGTPGLLVGDGAQLCFNKLSGRVQGLCLSPENLRYQRASGVCAAAALLEPSGYVTASDLEPVYLRLPQAERERLKRGETFKSEN